MRVILFGPPGVGKGTQAKLLSGVFDIPHVSTGDILRDAIASGSDLGKKAKGVIDAGHLVSDEIMIGVIREAFKSERTRKGFILDGFPRTVPQATALHGLLRDLGLLLDAVIIMEADESEILRRLGKRLTCKACGRTYNLNTDPLPDPATCPNCGGELYQREDDKPETIKKRLRVYSESTAPVKEYYKQSGALKTVDAFGSVEEVTRQILSLLKK